MAQPKLKAVPTPFVIESGVQLPHQRGPGKTPTRLAMEALAGAEIGDSVFVPASGSRYQGGQLSTVSKLIRPTRWVMVNKVEGGYRVWKVA